MSSIVASSILPIFRSDPALWPRWGKSWQQLSLTC
jgi:hypothetical protein